MKIQLSANWKHDCYYYYLKKGKTFPISISNVKLEFRISCRYKNRHMIYNVPPLLPKFRKLSTPLSPGTGCLRYGGVPRSKPQKGGPSSAIIAQARHEITFVAAPRDRPPSTSRIVSLHPPWNPRNCAICGAQVWWAEGKKIRPRFQYLSTQECATSRAEFLNDACSRKNYEWPYYCKLAARCTAARYVAIQIRSPVVVCARQLALFRSLTRRYSIQSSWLRSSALTLSHLFFLSFFLPLFRFFPPASATLHSFTLACSRSVLFFLLRSLVPSDPCYLLPLASFLSLSPFHRCLLFIHSSAPLRFALDFLSLFLSSFFPLLFFNSSRHDRSLHGTNGALAFPSLKSVETRLKWLVFLI